MDPSLAKIAYLIASVLFILGLKKMTHPRTAVRGNLFGATAMLLAMVVTFFDPDVKTFGWITAGLAMGGIVGLILAIRIQMTDMPQLVALFNGFGGLASTLVAGAELIKSSSSGADLLASAMVTKSAPTTDVMIATALSGIIGAVTFWGSLIAFGKLQELPPEINPDSGAVWI
ncbi:NAD(P)(+) transhydrogenase (Re/Si-specific) subunit beta, partial [Planctomycetota bacterium]